MAQSSMTCVKHFFRGMLLLFALLVLLLVKTGEGNTTRVCRFYDLQTGFNSNQSVLLEVTVYLKDAAVAITNQSTWVYPTKIDFVSFETRPYSIPTLNVTIQRTIQMVDSAKRPPVVMFTTKLLYGLSGNRTNVTNVVLEEDLGIKMQAFWSNTFKPGYSVPGVIFNGRQSVKYSMPYDLAAGENVTLAFEAEPAGDQGQALPAGQSVFSSVVSFLSKGQSFSLFTTHPVCIETTYIYNSNIIYQHGFTALSFFLALLFGAAMVMLVIFLYCIICRHRLKSSVNPSEHDEERMRSRGKKIVLDPKAAIRKGINAVKDYSIMEWNESIILILKMKDKLHMFREIDNLDILATIHVDTDLEQEQNEAYTQTSLLLVRGLHQHGDISKQVEDKAVNNYNSGLKAMEKRLDGEYKKDLETVYTDLSAKNKEKLAELLQKHRKQKADAINAAKVLPEKEREDLMNLIEKQQQIEDNDLTFTLALEQNEAAERLRKEYAIRKRMGMKELLQNMMAEVIREGKLTEEQADWIMKEHKKQQEAVHRMYDEEISRQRMVLEEKLARRRALAQASETQGDNTTENLNLAATHIIGYLQKAAKGSILTAEQTEEWNEEVKARALTIKHEMETSFETRETDLHKKLSVAKVTQLNELIKKHGAEVLEYNKRSQAQQTEEPIDPVAYAEGLLKLRSQHRVELASLENNLDAEHAKLLQVVHTEVVAAVEEKLSQLEKDTVRRLQENGMTEKALNALLKKHGEEKERLRQIQEKNLQNQDDKLKEELARRRREWAERREQERKEQEELRAHEAEVVEKLVNSQVSMSEAERDRIMKEHEKQMVLLENSLTLNKLRQQRSLEERLNQKRAQQLSALQQQQQTEIEKQQRAAENNGEEDDEKTHRARLELMKKHAEKRIAIIQGNQLNIDEELEQIRIEMIKERALSLRSQEERLSSMITALQLEKAREMTRIEEQQRAINSLKANLMDDLSERGILSMPECQRILDIHRQEAEALNDRLESQRAQQEKMLKAKLQERLKQREHFILARHEAEMRNLMTGPNKFASKVKRLMLIHKHMVKMEKFRNRMDREIAQSLAETQRQFEITKLQKLQDQELAFVAGLVRVGAFEENELLDVLRMLFPNKTEEDIHQVLNRITEGSQKRTEKYVRNGDEHKDSTIVERVYQSQYSGPSLLNRSGSISIGGSFRKSSRKGSHTSLTYSGAGDLDTVPAKHGFALREPGVGNMENGYINQAMRPGSATFRPSSASRQKPAYKDTSFNEPSGRRGLGRVSEDNYNGEGEDYIAMGVSMSHGGGREVPSGHLPPLNSQEEAGGRKKKKKKKGMLKKRSQVHEADYDELS